MKNSEDVVLIGNGPSATRKKNGFIIDSFDTVVRFNDYEIEGYEEHVGKKTTVWAINDIYRADKIAYRKQELWSCQVLVYGNKNIQACRENEIDYVRLLSYKRTILDNLREKWKPHARPTLGLIVISYFLFVLKYEKIFITGFDHMDPKKGRHYFFNRYKRHPHEDPNAEKRICDRLRKEGRIVDLL